LGGSRQEGKVANGRSNLNHHIRFVYEESDLSEASDSIHDYDGEENRLLKARQRNRKKKNMGSL